VFQERDAGLIFELSSRRLDEQPGTWPVLCGPNRG
jgi:hypothetical protein